MSLICNIPESDAARIFRSQPSPDPQQLNYYLIIISLSPSDGWMGRAWPMVIVEWWPCQLATWAIEWSRSSIDDVTQSKYTCAWASRGDVSSSARQGILRGKAIANTHGKMSTLENWWVTLSWEHLAGAKPHLKPPLGRYRYTRFG